jgi:hypothetical protein
MLSLNSMSQSSASEPSRFLTHGFLGCQAENRSRLDFPLENSKVSAIIPSNDQTPAEGR